MKKILNRIRFAFYLRQTLSFCLHGNIRYNNAKLSDFLIIVFFSFFNSRARAHMPVIRVSHTLTGQVYRYRGLGYQKGWRYETYLIFFNINFFFLFMNPDRFLMKKIRILCSGVRQIYHRYSILTEFSQFNRVCDFVRIPKSFIFIYLYTVRQKLRLYKYLIDRVRESTCSPQWAVGWKRKKKPFWLRLQVNLDRAGLGWCHKSCDK